MASIATFMLSQPILETGERCVVEAGTCESEQVAAGLIYGQVKKSYQRRKLVRVTHVMRLGTEAALKACLQGMGFSGRLNTAFIERVNLAVRHGVSALARRTWATAKPAPHLLAHVEWWRAYYHFVRPHQALRVALIQPAAARGQTSGTTRPPADARHGSRQNPPTLVNARGSELSFAAGALLDQVSVNEVRSCPVPQHQAAWGR